MKRRDDVVSRLGAISVDDLRVTMQSPMEPPSEKGKAQALYNEYLALQRLEKSLKLQISMCIESLKFKGVLAPATYAGAASNARIEAGDLSGMAGIPYYQGPQVGISLAIATDMPALSEALTDYLVKQVEQFQVEGLDLSLLTRQAPIEALTEEGQLLPLPSIAMKGDKYSVEQALLLFAAKKLTKSDFRIPTEWRAWQWLISSHNQVHPKNRIPLKNALKKEWNDPLGIKGASKAKERSSEVKTLREQVKALTAQLEFLQVKLEALTSPAEGMTKSAHTTRIAGEAMEAIEDALATVPDVQTQLAGPPSEKDSEEEVIWEDSPDDVEEDDWVPEILSLEGQEMLESPVWDAEFWMDRVSSVQTVAVFQLGGSPCVFVGPPQPATLSGDRDEIIPVKAKSRAKKARSPTPGPQKRSRPDEGKFEPRTSGSNKQSSPSGKSDQRKSSDATIKKGDRRSDQLTEAQRISLRRFFKLEDPLPQEEWAALTAKQKREHMASSSIPRWAVATVVDRPDLLKKVLDGSITKDNFRDATIKPPSPKSKGGKPSNTGSGQQRGRSRSRREARSSSRRKSTGRASSRNARGRRQSQPRGGSEYELMGKLVSRLLGFDSRNR
jgi:hypothetical protein